MGRAEFVTHTSEAQEARIGIRRIGEPPEHDREECALDGGPATHARREGLQMAQGAGGVTYPKRLDRSSMNAPSEGQSREY